ncbi:MAG: hypothetical protein IPO58_23910 [Betaproteobacteria bacterium]|nr:hypothetical protein [Betaproteobacteria bacterium]
MNFTPKSMALAMLVATTELAGVACAQAPKAPVAPVTQAAMQSAPAVTKAPITTKTPEDWIIYDDTTYTPVVDNVSEHLESARKALEMKDDKKAAAELRAVADVLNQQAARAGKADQALVVADKALVAEDTKIARDAMRRLNASALKVSSAAAAIERGKIKTQADLDKTIDKAARADMERRWLVTDVTTWYPVSEEPQRHFIDAVAAYTKKEYSAAATDIRKATSYLRLETHRATGAAKQELERSVAQLDMLAASVEKGAVKDEQSMTKEFARAGHALALGHRSKAAESWARKEYDKAGYELKAAAQGLESTASWIGGEAKAGASATVTDTRALGDKLAAGGTWTRDEITAGFESLGNGINALGRKIGRTKKASPFNAHA